MFPDIFCNFFSNFLDKTDPEKRRLKEQNERMNQGIIKSNQLPCFVSKNFSNENGNKWNICNKIGDYQVICHRTEYDEYDVRWGRGIGPTQIWVKDVRSRKEGEDFIINNLGRKILQRDK